MIFYKLPKRREFPLDTSSVTRDSTKSSKKRRKLDVPSANLLILKGASFPFRLKGDPKAIGVETDDAILFGEYAREQWMGSIVRNGMYLFDRYVMPDFAFQVIEVQPDEAIVTSETIIQLDTSSDSEPTLNRVYSLEDVVGHEEVKKKCKLILHYLEDPLKFGEWAPRAILFHGPPGTGKTLTARAVACEANANLFLVKASDLIGVHVGDGGRRISALFEDARRSAPSIIFLDELDAIGLARSFQSIRGDVSEIVTSLLGELDRTSEESGVVIIGATNAFSLIDSAVRSRFDASFEFDLPNDTERLELVSKLIARLPLPVEFDISFLVSQSRGLSGRDLRDRILKESLHIAITNGLPSITNDVLIQVLDRIKGRERPSYTI
ncbi:MAG: hypothetical protein BAJATHORv1_20468 [Candidatus Thorarchaeota archaeon]|nr:MAG: hypothetical protein BAJATHORv1_20468 [Candidatus Thorarchaeota archaeon]